MKREPRLRPTARTIPKPQFSGPPAPDAGVDLENLDALVTLGEQALRREDWTRVRQWTERRPAGCPRNPSSTRKLKTSGAC